MNRSTSRTLLAALALLVVLGAALAAGCTSGAPAGGAATAAATGAPATAESTAVAGVTGGAAAVNAVGHERLAPFVPRSAGAWKLDGEPQGLTMKDSEGRDYTWVTGEYRKSGSEDVQGSLAITDNGVATSPLKQQWQSFASLDTTEMSMKQVTVKGQPAWRIEQKQSNEHSIMVLVGDRIMVWVQVTDGTGADLDALVDAIDFAGIAAVK